MLERIIIILFLTVIIYNVVIKNKYLEGYIDVDTNIVNSQYFQTHIILVKILKDIHSLFAKYRLPYFVDRNTLVSTVLFSKLDPSIDECDISLFNSDKKRFLALVPWFQRMGYGVVKFWGGYRIYPYSGYPIKYLNKTSQTRLEDRNYFDYKYPFVNVMFVSVPTYGSDVYVYNNKYLRRFYDDIYISKNDLFPLKLYKFYDFEVYGPNKPNRFISLINKNFGQYPLVKGNIEKLRKEKIYEPKKLVNNLMFRQE